MLRALALAILFLATPRGADLQPTSVLHIRITLADADGRATPIPRHTLLVSENPTSALPRRVATALDGTADIKLRPGNYTVESERPVAFQGKAYGWTQTLDIVAGKDAVLELTAGNAEVGEVSAATDSGKPLDADSSSLLAQWQDSVFALWTPTAHASGFVVDAKGLIATNQRSVGTATAVEVQVAPTVKVAARVLAIDAVRDVAILWADPKALAAAKPLPLACGQPGKPLAKGQELFTMETPLRGPLRLSSGAVSRIERDALMSDLFPAAGAAGGPVFTGTGDLVGLTTVAGERDDDSRIVTRDDACTVLAAATAKMAQGPAPDGAHLPMEPERPFPVDLLKEAVKGRAGNLHPYTVSSPDFDVALITPVLTFGVQYQAEQASRGRDRSAPVPVTAAESLRPLVDFGDWSDYVSDFPPVLLVRVTPKMVESFWTTVARGAARTQGVDLPAFKHFKSGFSRLRAFCGDTEITPVHPFKIGRQVSETETVYEGLYVFDPGAIGPHCASVKLMLYSEKEPGTAKTVVVDPKTIEQAWQDFAPYRALDRTPGL